jgi:hypothetical protein
MVSVVRIDCRIQRPRIGQHESRHFLIPVR